MIEFRAALLCEIELKSIWEGERREKIWVRDSKGTEMEAKEIGMARNVSPLLTCSLASLTEEILGEMMRQPLEDTQTGDESSREWGMWAMRIVCLRSERRESTSKEETPLGNWSIFVASDFTNLRCRAISLFLQRIIYKQRLKNTPESGWITVRKGLRRKWCDACDA